MRLDETGSGKDEDQDGGHLDQHHDVVGASRLADAAHQEHRQEHHDQEGRNVEAEMPAGSVEVVARKVLQAGGQVGRGDPLDGQMDAKPVEEVYQVSGEAHADAHVAESVFENQIPADDPGDQLAEGGVGVGVSRAGNGNHGGQFGVTEAGEDADDGHQHQRERQRRPCAGTACHGRVVDEVVEQRRVADIRHIELLPGHGGADDREDTRADDRPDAQRGQRPRAEGLFQGVPRLLRVPDQLIDGLAGNKLSEQDGSPHSAGSGGLRIAGS